MSVKIEIADELLSALKIPLPEAEKELRKELALALYARWALPLGMARKMAPGHVTRVIIKSRYSAVALPGLIPGTKPPYFFMFSAMSTGLKVIAV